MQQGCTVGGTMMKYKTEAFDMWLNLSQIAYEPVIRCRFDFEERVDLDMLTQAVALSMDTIPLIACCFDDSGGRPRWTEKGFTAQDMVWECEAEDDIDGQIKRLLFTEMNFAEGPQLKVFLVRRSDGDTLCVIISHIICDAGGFKHYLYLLSELYTALNNNTPVPVYPFYLRGTKPLFTDVKLKEKIHILRSEHKALPSNSKKKTFVDFQKNSGEPHLEIRHISKENFARLKRFAKTNNFTVNDVFMTLLARAFCADADLADIDVEQVKIPCTIDLRRFIPDGVNYGITNYTANCICTFSFKSEDSLADAVNQISKQMQWYKDGKNILKSVILWELAVRFLSYGFLKRNFRAFFRQTPLAFSNVGTLDQNRLRFGDLAVKDAYLTGSPTSGPLLVFSVSTYDDRCTISVSFYGSDSDAKQKGAILDGVCAGIETLP
jgi:NRPS condensation-like uncharacterized protein